MTKNQCSINLWKWNKKTADVSCHYWWKQSPRLCCKQWSVQFPAKSNYIPRPQFRPKITKSRNRGHKLLDHLSHGQQPGEAGEHWWTHAQYSTQHSIVALATLNKTVKVSTNFCGRQYLIFHMKFWHLFTKDDNAKLCHRLSSKFSVWRNAFNNQGWR